MSEEELPTTDETGDSKPAQRSQVPQHVPPHLHALFTKHEGAYADRPGFRNPSNRKTKAQKKGKKR
jgi:hypothetical protein